MNRQHRSHRRRVSTRLIGYQLNDHFTLPIAAGSLNATIAEPGPGTRTVTDAETNLSTTDHDLSAAIGTTYAAATLYEPALIYSDVPLARAPGRLAIFPLTPAATNKYLYCGLHEQSTLDLTNEAAAYRLDNAGTITTRAQSANGPVIGTYSPATLYKFAIVLRAAGAYYFIKGGAFTHWTLLWSDAVSSAATVYAYLASLRSATIYSMAFTSPHARAPWRRFLPTPLAYDSFTRSNGAIGISETTGPDSQNCSQRTWTGATWTILSNKALNTPAEGAETLTDGNMEDDPTNNWTPQTATLTEEADERTGGSGVQSLALHWGSGTGPGTYQQIACDVGDWLLYTGWHRKVTMSPKPQLLAADATLIIEGTYNESTSWTSFVLTGRTPDNGARARLRSYAVGAAECRLDDCSLKVLTLNSLFATQQYPTPDVRASVDIRITLGLLGGMVICLDDADNPQNFVIVYHNKTNALLEKCVSGAYTTVISAAATYSPGATLTVTKHGTAWQLHYNNAKIGSTSTISDAGIINNTLHGLFSTHYDSNDNLDNFTIFARGTSNQYKELDRF